ncbi:M28 family metallopeptidase [Pseudoxanthomonas sp. UTMC 1351]|uniref:M28 family metallopeptidase n=1 Tax=Pseudoxanthomonas sp. UTMC 1351 TaxID=2695853 RepID=UPI0034CF0EAE
MAYRAPFFRFLLRSTAVLAMLVALPACAGASTSWENQVREISEGQDSLTRGAAIGARLDAMNIAWRKEVFSQDDHSGSNLIADLGGRADAPLLLIGAHYDKVAAGHGATDNASGVSTVLELAAALKARPLANHRVQVVFWDLEEEGLLGSRAWVATPGREKPALYVNFDVFGWGDTLWMMSPQADAPLVTAMRTASTEHRLHFRAGAEYPPTDHLAFLKAGWPAVSFSLIGGDEIDPTLKAFSGGKPNPIPKVMRVIHSPNDTVAELDADSVPAALATLENGLRAWDLTTQ